MNKSILSILLASGALFSTQAAVFQFNLGPGGLNGANERPTPVVTTATGGELEGLFPEEPGISYDDVTKQLFLNFAWGTDHGYTDLEGSYIAMHIHGSATSDVNSAAGVIYNIDGLKNLTSVNGQDGGVFQKGLILFDNPNNTGLSVAQQEAQLFAGRWYINVHSSPFFGGGEIRGQLIPVPEPQTYAMFAGLALLGFAGYRRYQAARA